MSVTLKNLYIGTCSWMIDNCSVTDTLQTSNNFNSCGQTFFRIYCNWNLYTTIFKLLDCCQLSVLPCVTQRLWIEILCAGTAFKNLLLHKRRHCYNLVVNVYQLALCNNVESAQAQYPSRSWATLVWCNTNERNCEVIECTVVLPTWFLSMENTCNKARP